MLAPEKGAVWRINNKEERRYAVSLIESVGQHVYLTWNGHSDLMPVSTTADHYHVVKIQTQTHTVLLPHTGLVNNYGPGNHATGMINISSRSL